MLYSEIIQQVSEELNLPKELVDKTYKAYWTFIRESIEKLPLKEELDSNRFNQLKTSINIPSLGKFNCTYKRYLGLRERFTIINKLRQKK